MSTQTIVLYGNRLFDAETYSTNQDPESLSVSLSDSTSLADLGITDAVNKAIADAITAADARIVASGTKALSDSSTLTETIAKALSHAFSAETVTLSDSQVNAAIKALPGIPTTTAGFPLFGALDYAGSQYGSNADGIYDGRIFIFDAIVSFLAEKSLTESLTLTEQRIFNASVALAEGILIVDAAVRLTQIKGFSEFILLQDWLELRWKKAEVWDTTAAYGLRPSQIHNYGPGVYYGFDFYSSNPSVSWLLQTASEAVWDNNTVTAEPLPLYAQIGYGSRDYSAMPAVGWIKPTAQRQNWTNQNGESHN